MTTLLQRHLADARIRALSPDDAVSERAEIEAACLQALDGILRRPDRAEAALSLALRLTRSPIGPAEAERWILAWAAGCERPCTETEARLLTVAAALRGET